ncbi:hypothetical protein P0E20_002377 [Vibrio harveyi]|uniref:Uncharacterized protein n=1 Tax=Vibrio harveyi TaxID=669 RepID=A0ABN4L976_VIBHA|nr:hypothetical protein AL538_24295 [Vibrio harveyi]EKO3868416.1 hypothetical protein [Vibrio harveyi]
MEIKIAHLGFIQGVINRMGQNSFLLKGWSITLIAALFALAAKDANEQFALIAYIPTVVFWLLDAFFLHQEKLYRKLYEQVAEEIIDSSKFTLNTSVVRDSVEGYASVILSKTLLPFYGLIILVNLFAMFCILT